jgi:hypothetical protein
MGVVGMLCPEGVAANSDCAKPRKMTATQRAGVRDDGNDGSIFEGAGKADNICI